MTRDQIARVQTSWALVVPVAETVASQFYERLFTLDPTLRSLFASTDSIAQGRKLMQTLAVVVAGLHRLSELAPAIEALGRRHASYGVTTAHYATVRSALLWTLARALGDDFDDPTRAAWTTAYDRLANTMIGAATRGGCSVIATPSHGR